MRIRNELERRPTESADVAVTVARCKLLFTSMIHDRRQPIPSGIATFSDTAPER
jgi:hypothetical protein